MSLEKVVVHFHALVLEEGGDELALHRLIRIYYMDRAVAVLIVMWENCLYDLYDQFSTANSLNFKLTLGFNVLLIQCIFDAILL